MVGYIYKTTNLINNKIYVGQHLSTKFDRSYYGSGIYIKKALNKYGRHNFKVEILEWAKDIESLNILEIEYISKLCKSKKKSYNRALDGQGTYSLIDGEHNPRYNIKRYWVNNGKINKQVTENELESYINNGFQKGQIRSHNWSIKDRIAVNKDGITRYINKDELQNYLDLGYSIGNNRTKNKMIKVKPVKSQFGNTGMIFINNLKENKMIFPKDLDMYLKQGWIKGRIPISKEANMAKVEKVRNYILENKESFSNKIKDGLNKSKKEGKNKGTLGKVCINNGIDNKFIFKEEFEFYQELGYNLGMIETNKEKLKEVNRNKIMMTNGKENKWCYNEKQKSDLLSKGFYQGLTHHKNGGN